MRIAITRKVKVVEMNSKSKKSIKSSVSRKRMQGLSRRQIRRIRQEILHNLRSDSPQNCSTASGSSNVQQISSSANANYSTDVQDNVYETFSSASSVSSSSSSSLFSSSASCSEIPFAARLASYFVENNITHTQANSILNLLRTHPCFSTLPKDVRTILKTPRTSRPVIYVPPGEYIHLGVESEVVKYLSSFSTVTIQEIHLDFSTDGCTLDKSANIQIWPIQCRVINLQCIAKPLVVGIYKGPTKPNDPNVFFHSFITELESIFSNGGITFNNSKFPVKLHCFIADASARAFILNHKGHVSQHPCSKCKISGSQVSGRYVFNEISNSPRTDLEYVRCIDEDHHKEGNSPLSALPIGMVSQVPFEYMHLVCLGVVKKLLSAWIDGKFMRSSKLSSRQISSISSRLNDFKKYCPSEFSRLPRNIEKYGKYKATEFRQFLLYTGPVAMFGIHSSQLYNHFLLLHTAMRILVAQSQTTKFLKFAEVALEKFVLRCESFYGPTFTSYNVHGLLHITNDVRHLGPLDSFSSFPYENNMQIFRKYCRKPGQFLQQFSNRMSEIDSNINISSRVAHPSGTSLRCHQLEYNGLVLGTSQRDNCCILHDGSICIIIEIKRDGDCPILGVKKFTNVGDFYHAGAGSSAFQMYRCSELTSDISYISAVEVSAKCYRMPFSEECASDSSSSSGAVLDTSTYVAAVILHTEKL